MRSDDAPPSSSDKADTPPTVHPAACGIIYQQSRQSIAPVSLQIDCPMILEHARRTQGALVNHRDLIKELQLWSPLLKRRPVNRLWINDPFVIMDPPNLTELIYAVGQNVRLCHGHHIEHTVVLCCESASRNNVALLKGLEFNHLQLSLCPACTLEQAESLSRSVMGFKFPFISVTLPDLATINPSTIERFLAIIHTLQPGQIMFDEQHQSDVTFAALRGIFAKDAYHNMTPGCLTRQNFTLPRTPPDQVSVGPGGVSLLGATTLVNTTHYQHYRTLLAHDALPITQCNSNSN